MNDQNKMFFDDKRKFLLKRSSFTIFLIFSCLIGPNFSLTIFGIQLSLYRFALVIALIIFFNSSIKQLFKHKKTNGIIFIYFLFVWFLYSLINFLWISDYASWSKYLAFLGSGFIVSFLIIANINSSNLFIAIIKMVVILAGLLGLLGIYESLTGNYYFLDSNSLEWYRDTSLLQKVTNFREPITVFANPNNYALFLFYTVAFTAMLIFREKKKYVKFLYISILIICLFSIIITLSRSAVLGLIIFSLSLLYFLFKKGTIKIKKSVIKTSIFILIVLFYFILHNANFIDDIFVFDISSDGSSDYLRQNLIFNGFSFLYNSLFLGVGLGNIEFYMKFKSLYDVGTITNIHNWWMEILVSSGIFIFLFYLFIYLNTFIKSVKNINFNLSEDLFWINSVFASLQLGFIFASIGPSSLIGCEWFWPLLALTYKVPYLSDNLVNK